MEQSKPYTVAFRTRKGGPAHRGDAYESWDLAADACRFLVEGGGAFHAWIESAEDRAAGAHHG